MKTRSMSPVFLIPVLALYSTIGLSQDLTLFQDSGGNNPRAQFGPGGANAGAAAAAPTAPGLTLKGVYRFGNEYHVSLQDEQGSVYTATWQRGANNGVGAVVSGYQLQGVDSKTVTLAMPAGVACQQNLASGTNCLSRNQVALTLAEAAPVTTRQTRTVTRGNNNLPAFLQNNGNNNPFGGNTDIRALFEAARSGDPNAAQAARDAIRNAIGNRGRGGGDNGTGRGNRGGRGGFGGNNNGGNNGGGNNGGGNNGGGNFVLFDAGNNGGNNNGGNNNNGGRGGGGFRQ